MVNLLRGFGAKNLYIELKSNTKENGQFFCVNSKPTRKIHYTL